MDTMFSILHVVTAVFVIGPMAILPMTSLRILRAGDTSRAASSARAIRLLSYLSLVVLVTGFGVMGMADPQYDLSVTTPWVLASIGLYFVALLVTLAVVVPAFQSAVRDSTRAIYTRAATGSGLASFCLLAVVVLMVWKP